MSEKSEYAIELQSEKQRKDIRKRLRTFEKMTLESLSDYYAFNEEYEVLQDVIAALEDDKLRKSFMKRLKGKYESLKKENEKWSKVAAEYTKAQQEEYELLAREREKASEEAREKQLRESRVKLARARVKKLRAYNYLPSNAEALIAQAKEAVEACKNYSEYDSLKRDLEKNIAYLMALPVKNSPKDPLVQEEPTVKPESIPGPEESME